MDIDHRESDNRDHKIIGKYRGSGNGDKMTIEVMMNSTKKSG